MKYISIVLFFCMLVSCDTCSILSGAGTHGSLASYSYTVSKDSLETAIKLLIESEDKITRLKLDGKGDTYVKIVLKIDDIQSFFVFRYAGDYEYWESHPNESHISITATKVGENEYKSEGEIKGKDKKEAIRVFEEYFIKALIEQENLRPIDN
jgi:hypothetical protein